MTSLTDAHRLSDTLAGALLGGALATAALTTLPSAWYFPLTPA